MTSTNLANKGVITVAMSYMQVFEAVAIAIVTCVMNAQAVTTKDDTQSAFLNPPNAYRPTVRYWLPDASISMDVLQSDIDDLAKAGMGGFEFLPFYLYGLPNPNGPPPTDWNKFGYGTPAYKRVFNAAIEASEKNKLLMSFAIGANQGQGSPAKMESKGLAKELALASVVVPSGGKFSGNLPLPPDQALGEMTVTSFMHKTEHRIEQKLVAVVAAKIERGKFTNAPLVLLLMGNCVVDISNYSNSFLSTSIPMNNTYLDESSLVVITSKVKDGKLDYQPPSSGNWQIFAFYERYTNQKSCTGAPIPDSIIGNGSWVVDHFSKSGAQVTTDFIDENILDSSNQKALANIGQYAWEDSMEMYAPAFWTPDFLAEFRARRKYDLTKYLPVLFNGDNVWGQILPPYGNRTYIGGGSDGGQGVNDDYRTTLTELNQRYIQHMQDWSHQKGLEFSNQPAYNLPIDMAAQIPFVDTPETESLGFPTIDLLRRFTGPAHMAQKTVISSETGALTVNSSAYSQTIPELLVFVNEQLVTGVNMFVLHGTPYSGDYSQTTWPSYTPFFYNVPEMHSRCLPAWGSYKYSMDYIARNSLISQTGTARIDLAFLNDAMAFGLKSAPIELTTELASAGFSYEYIGPTNLDLKSANVQNKLLSPQGPAFRALVIDGEGAYPYEVLSKLEGYANDGFPIVFLNSVPTNVSGACLPPCNVKNFQMRFKKLVSQYPDTVKIASSYSTILRALSMVGVKPRIAFTNGSWYHSLWKSAQDSKVDYVYFYNINQTAEATFTIELPEIRYPFKLNAWTGAYSPIVDFKRDRAKIIMTIALPKDATTIIAFAKNQVFNGQRSPEVSVVKTGENILGFDCKNGMIIAKATGDSSVTLSTGDEITVRAKANAPSTLQKWDVVIEDWHPTSNISSTVTEITNHTILETELKPWTEYNLPNVSGIGHYSTSFTLSTVDAILSLGPIQNTVRVYLNGHELPPVDLFNAVIDISKYSRVGVNQLQIDVSTTLFNAAKSRSSTIKTAGTPASLANPRLAESVPSVKYGLLGPVTITPYKPTRVA
ncbi:hypothetical protein BKA64DRAFT_777464 [Cadophora sp. MPI-SDFR-AT-0126]|nr:hypothetical protein BKA64DRAFT_777464 [Leotiomycetes sp. MPI-SDFR-AT-0126]